LLFYQTAKKDNLKWIGILDVFGFECFEHNSFEQFCINFANERLQEFFNTYIIASEQALYRAEAIVWEAINVPSNQDTIDLVERRPQCILAILDSTCVMPKGTADIFTSTLHQQFEGHRRLTAVKAIRYQKDCKHGKGGKVTRINGFAIQHYAGTVIYNAEAFLVKNHGSTHPDTIALFSSSATKVTKEMFAHLQPKKPADGGNGRRAGGGRFVSTSSVFAGQLGQLLDMLKQTRPFFVRCIKPNLEQVAKTFTADYVRPQLRCGGLIEALRILKCGFPTRCPYQVVYDRFSKLLQPTPANVNVRDFTEGIFVLLAHPNGLSPADYQMGLTMVFFRPGKQAYLEDVMTGPKISEAKIEKLRQYLVYKRMTRLRGVVKAQTRVVRKLNRLRAWESFRKAANTMTIYTKTLRKFLRRVRYRKASVVMQAAIRAFEAVECRRRGMPYGAMFDLSKNPLFEAQRQVHQWVRDITQEELPGDFLEECETGVVLCKLQAILDPDNKVKCNATASAGTYQARDNIMAFLSGVRDAGVDRSDLFDQADLVKWRERGDKSVKNVVTTLLQTAKVFYKKGSACPQMIRDLIEKGFALPKLQTTEELLRARKAVVQEAQTRKRLEAEAAKEKLEAVKRAKEEEERKVREEEARVKREEARRKREEEERVRAEQVRVEEEQKRRVEEEARKKREEEERKRRIEEEKRRREEEEQRRVEEEERRRVEEETREKKRRDDERARKREEERVRQEEEEAARRREEEHRLKVEEEARKRREDEARKRREEEERVRVEEDEQRKREEEDRRKREAERRRVREEAERERRVEMERLREIAEEEERKRAEEAAERKRKTQERKKRLQESKKYFTEGFGYMRSGDTQAAIECFDKATELNPKYATAFATRGLAHWMRGEFQKTLDDCNKAVELDPDYAQPYTTRGLALRELGDRKRAIEDYSKAIELDANSVEAFNNRGLAWREEGEHEKAIEDCNRAIRIMPKYAAAYNNRGIAHWAMENVDAAIEDFLNALSLNPNDAKAANSLGLAFWKREEVEPALKYYNMAVGIDPHYADAYANRGVAERYEKNYEQAIGSYEEAARCFKRRGEADAAKAASETASEIADILANL
jgi:tetratricopeptide (TPR) repeat protein